MSLLCFYFFKVARGLSFRVLRVVYQELSGGEVPSLSTLHYRLKKTSNYIAAILSEEQIEIILSDLYSYFRLKKHFI